MALVIRSAFLYLNLNILIAKLTQSTFAPYGYQLFTFPLFYYWKFEAAVLLTGVHKVRALIKPLLFQLKNIK
jgi:hypothetical protein